MNLFKLLTLITLLFSKLLCATEVVVISHPFPPWQFIENGQVKGINIDLLSLVGKKLDIKFSYKHQPWARAWVSVKRGRGDAIIASSRKKQREKYLSFPPIDTNLWTSNYVFFTHSHYRKSYSGQYKDILNDNKTVCIVNGYSYDEGFWETFPYQDDSDLAQRSIYQPDNRKYHPLLISSNGIEQCIDLLARHRVAVVIADKSIGLYYINKLKGIEKMHLAAKGLVAYPEILFSKGYTISFIKQSTHPELADISDKIWSELRLLHSNGQYQKIVSNWIDKK